MLTDVEDLTIDPAISIYPNPRSNTLFLEGLTNGIRK